MTPSYVLASPALSSLDIQEEDLHAVMDQMQTLLDAWEADGQDPWQPAQTPPAPDTGAVPRDADAVDRERLLNAQALLAAGGGDLSRWGAARQAQASRDRVDRLFDLSGRMFLGTRAVSLLLSPDGARFAALPRTLTPADAQLLDQVLQQDSDVSGAGGLRHACLQAGMSPIVVDYLFRRDGSLTGRLDVLTDVQREALLARCPGETAGAAASWQPARQGRIPAARMAIYLEAQRQVAAGGKLGDVALGLGLGATTLHKFFSDEARLLVTAGVDALLRSAEGAQRRAFEEMPRALRPKDLADVVYLLKQQSGRPMQELRAAGARAGIPEPVLDHLFNDQGLRELPVATLPLAQAEAIAAALGALPQSAAREVEPAAAAVNAPPQAARRRRSPAIPAERQAALIQAQQLLAQRMTPAATAAHVNVPSPTLCKTFSAEGHLLVTRQGEALLEMPDAGQRAPFEAMSRALRHKDLLDLAEGLRVAAGTPAADLRAAAAHARVPEEVLAFLFDDTGLRVDQVLSLPSDQASALFEAAGYGPGAEAALPSARARREAAGSSSSRPQPGSASSATAAMLVRAQAGLAAGRSPEVVAAELNISDRLVHRTFDRQGRLLIGRYGARLLRVNDDPLRTVAEQLPRALRPADLGLLVELLRRHAQAPLPNLREEAVGTGVDKHAVEHLFEGDTLRMAAIESLPDDQGASLQRALSGALPDQDVPSSPPAEEPSRSVRMQAGEPGDTGPASTSEGPGSGARVSHARTASFVQAAQLLAEGMPMEVAANGLDISLAGLRGTFDRDGRLLINEAGSRLLRVDDPDLRTIVEALPRALGASDLTLLSDVCHLLLDGAVFNLREAAEAAGVSGHALDYLFDAEGGLREEQAAGLPTYQQDVLLLPGFGAVAGPRRAANLYTRPSRAMALAEAQRLIAGGMLPGEAATRVNLPADSVTNTFDRQGRLQVSKPAATLLRVQAPALRAQFEALPRALRRIDVTTLCEVLRQHAFDPFDNLRAAALGADLGAHAVEYLFDEAGSLRNDRLAALPDAQLHRLLAALAGMEDEGPAPQPRVVAPRRAATQAPEAAPASARPAAPPAPIQPPASEPPRSARPPRPPRAPRAARPPEASVTNAAAAMPGAAEVSAVLRFFHERPDVRTFGQAQRHFGLSPEALLSRLSRAGVTEMEARAGTVPDTSVLWQRLRAVIPHVPSQAAVSPGDFDGFASSVEALYASPLADLGTAESSARKRSAGSAPAGQPSTSRARTEGASDVAAAVSGTRSERTPRADGLWGRLLSWGTGRFFSPAAVPTPPRSASRAGTPSEGGLPDPGTPTAADLAFPAPDLADLLQWPQSPDVDSERR